MSTIPEAVRTQALNPFRELPKPNNVEQFLLDGALLTTNPYPGAQMAWPTSLDVDVATVVEAARAIAREQDKTIVAWWIAPEHDALASAFEMLGIVNKDTPGYEAVENAMALVGAPRGERPEDVELRTVASYKDHRDVARVVEATFGHPPQTEEAYRDRYEDYLSDDFGESFVALLDGKIVASAFAAFGKAGLNLFGGSVLEEARGRGIYRALTFARWDEAVERGTPALTVQAGKMSMPILEKLGFEFVAPARVFVDELSS
jgi:GNAT superfamily N-acetyltransferase